MATYTTRLSAQAKAQHVPLGQALREYAGAANRDKLLSLLLPVQRAAEHCDWLRPMIDAGEIFHPLRWGPAEAARFLPQPAGPGSAGVVVRMPAAWRANRPPRPQVTATVGSRAPSARRPGRAAGFPHGRHARRRAADRRRGRQPCSPAPRTWCCCAANGSRSIARGFERTMEQFRAAEELAARDGLSFAEAMRMLAGAAVDRRRAGGGRRRLVAGDRRPLAGGDAAGAARTGRRRGRSRPGAARHAAALPEAGTQWLHLLAGLGLGACLADDMGLGKTIQVLSLLLVRTGARRPAAQPSLLVAPASLLGNWAAEIEKFAPGLQGGDRASLGDAGGAAQGSSRRSRRRSSTWRSPATARCCASRRWRRPTGASSSSMRRRRSRIRTRGRPARPRR